MSNIKNIFLSLNKTCFLLLFLSCFNFAYGGMSPCSGGDTKGTKFFYKDGLCYAAYCYMGAISWLGKANDSSCSATCKPGVIQYQASGACGQRSRICCNNADWSGWAEGSEGGDCQSAPNCSSSECWNGAFCESANSNYNPECTRKCVYGRGWKFTKVSYTGKTSWEYYRPGGREYSYSGKCPGSINTAACDSYIKLGNGWDVLENSANLPGFCEKQPEGFYFLADWRCEDGARYVGSPEGYTSSGVTKMWCKTGNIIAVKSIVSCTRSTKNC